MYPDLICTVGMNHGEDTAQYLREELRVPDRESGNASPLASFPSNKIPLRNDRA